MIYTVNHVTKRPSRSREVRNRRPCSMMEPEKIFDGLPDSSLKHVVFSRTDRGGGDIQGLCSVLITIVTIMYYQKPMSFWYYILRSEPNDVKVLQND